jgi:uncharacterized protein with FMN-binding domain
MIRKTAFLVTGTVTGLVAVLSYNPPELDKAISASGVAPSTDVTQSATKVTSQATPASKPSSKATSKKSKAAVDTTPTPTQSQSSGLSGTFQGDTSQTRWGPVQVQITMTDGAITDVSTLQYPNGDRKSMKISSQVIPWLQQETLQVQSAEISGISGATYTSTGFRESLASALQKAGR